jgi:hypothetical protein
VVDGKVNIAVQSVLSSFKIQAFSHNFSGFIQSQENALSPHQHFFFFTLAKIFMNACCVNDHANMSYIDPIDEIHSVSCSMIRKFAL